VGDVFVVQLGSDGVTAACHVGSVFIFFTAAIAHVVRRGEANEITIAAIEVRDMACHPVLKGLGKFVHNFAHAVPIN
jgi:hypothetical protein